MARSVPLLEYFDSVPIGTSKWWSKIRYPLNPPPPEATFSKLNRFDWNLVIILKILKKSVILLYIFFLDFLLLNTNPQKIAQ